MGRQAFYRQWRSQTFGQVVGQDPITRTLRNALQSGRLVHAYLFCGPRGVGKTSMARILAKAANCQDLQDGEPCDRCPSCVAITEGRCLDIIEIDAASRNSVEDVRDLRDKVNFAPSEVKYKFYILDEDHMLSASAFNALLKTLEEPPAHAIFVLVTTEVHRLPPTVISRCQRLDFRRIGLADTVKQLALVCKSEGIEAEPAALDYIGRLSTGSLRDAESILDQLVSYCGSKLTLEVVREVLGAAGSQASRDLVGMLADRDLARGLRLINELAADGVELRQFLREVVGYLRGLMLVKLTGDAGGLLEATPEEIAGMRQAVAGLSGEQLVALIRIMAQAEGSFRLNMLQLPLEMAFVEGVLALQRTEARSQKPEAKDHRPQAGSQRTEDNRQPEGWGREAPPIRAPAPAPMAVPPPLEVPVPVVARANAPVIGSGDLESEWPALVASFGETNAMLQALLHGCRPVRMEDGVLVLGFDYAFHQQQLQANDRRMAVEDALSQRMGKPCRVRCVVLPKDEKSSQRSAVDDPLVKAVLAAGGKIKMPSAPAERPNMESMGTPGLPGTTTNP